jgi:protein tyrosine phosphatase (PTP) superfamily phosphohydrolase (DUF442 family)
MSSFRRAVVCVFVFSVAASARPAIPGIRNFHEVDRNVYRGGQPTRDGFVLLARIGVKTDVDLREPGERSDWEKQTVTALGMHYVNVPMTGLTPPSQVQITKILGILEDGAGPVFVHCRRGSDRTGAVIAAYRIDHDHWGNARALQEAKADGIAFFQFPRKNYILHFHPRTLEAESSTESNRAKAPSPAFRAAVAR